MKSLPICIACHCHKTLLYGLNADGERMARAECPSCHDTEFISLAVGPSGLSGYALPGAQQESPGTSSASRAPSCAESAFPSTGLASLRNGGAGLGREA